MGIQRAISDNNRACRIAADGLLRAETVTARDINPLPLLALSLLLPTGCRA